MKKKPFNPVSCLAASGILLLCVFLVMTNMNCSGKSEEDLVRESIEKMVGFAEDNDLEGAMEYISPDYSDDEGRNMEDIAQLLEKYLGRYRGIAINMLGARLIRLQTPQAEVETDIGLSSGAARVFRKMTRYSGYFYRFKIKMTKQGKKWLVQSASWEHIQQEELHPESAEALKKLFPNI
jgi:hypothetical protein